MGHIIQVHHDDADVYGRTTWFVDAADERIMIFFFFSYIIIIIYSIPIVYRLIVPVRERASQGLIYCCCCWWLRRVLILHTDRRHLPVHNIYIHIICVLRSPAAAVHVWCTCVLYIDSGIYYKHCVRSCIELHIVERR